MVGTKSASGIHEKAETCLSRSTAVRSASTLSGLKSLIPARRCWLAPLVHKAWPTLTSKDENANLESSPAADFLARNRGIFILLFRSAWGGFLGRRLPAAGARQPQGCPPQAPASDFPSPLPLPRRAPDRLRTLESSDHLYQIIIIYEADASARACAVTCARQITHASGLESRTKSGPF